MALPSVDYTPRDPAADVLYRVVRDHLQTLNGKQFIVVAISGAGYPGELVAFRLP